MAATQPIGEQLYAEGWRQGSLFILPGTAILYNRPNQSEGALVIDHDKKLTKENQLFVLASQECDLVAKESEEPFVEVILCRLEGAKFVAKIRNRSTRYFAVDPNNLVVAVAPYRAFVEKSALLGIKPLPWPSGPDNLDLFIRWLATRYDRPAVPDEVVNAFDIPLRDLLERLAEEQFVVLDIFNQTVREIRVRGPLTEIPPYEMHMMLLTNSEELSEEGLEVGERIYEEMVNCLNPALVSIDPAPRWASTKRTSIYEYEQTRLLTLEFLSYHGDTPITEALPIRRSNGS